MASRIRVVLASIVILCVLFPPARSSNNDCAGLTRGISSLFDRCTFHIISHAYDPNCLTSILTGSPLVIQSNISSDYVAGTRRVFQRYPACRVSIWFPPKNSIEMTYALIPIDSIPEVPVSPKSSTMYFAMTDSRLFLICPHCPEKVASLTSSVNSLSLDRVEKEWFKFNQNLHGSSIMYPDLNMFQIQSDCQYLGKEFRGEELICAIGSIIEILNGTLIFSKGNESSSPILGLVRNTLIQYLLPLKYEFLQNSYFSEPYSFAFVLDKESNSYVEIDPLDAWTTAGRGVSLITIAAVFAIKFTNNFRRRREWRKKPSRFKLARTNTAAFYRNPKMSQRGDDKSSNHQIIIQFWNYAQYYGETFAQLGKPLVEQGDAKIGIRLSLDPSDYILYFLLTVWLLMPCLVINGAYKGSLYSIMTKEIPPQQPDTLASLLASSSLPILSTEFFKNEKTGRVDSFLRHLIQESVMEKKFQESDLKTYTALHERLQLLAGTHGLIIGAYATGMDIGGIYIPNNSDSQNQTRTDSYQPYFMPRDFAIIGFRSGINHFVSLTEQFPTVFTIRNDYADPFISLNAATVTSRNTFGQKFFPDLYMRQHESGVYGKWAENRERLFFRLDESLILCLCAAKNPSLEFPAKQCENYESREVVNSPFQAKQRTSLNMKIVLRQCDVLWFGLAWAFVSFLIELGIGIGLWEKLQGNYRVKKSRDER